MTKLFVATKAIVLFEGKALLLRESSKYEDGQHVGKYDVPGGRLNEDEDFMPGLLREIREETGLEVTVKRPFHMTNFRPIVDGEEWNICATFFECEAKSNTVTLSKDHDEYIWIDPKTYKDYSIAPSLVEVFERFLDAE